MNTKKSKYSINKGIIIQKNKDSTTIFDPDKSYLFTMNETATFIFQSIKRGYSLKKISEQLSSLYKISLLQAEKDVLKCIDTLKKNNILSNG